MTRKAAKLNMITQEGRKSQVSIARHPMGIGADAKIFQITGLPDTVAKIYHDPAKDSRRADKIRAMLANPPALSPIWEGGLSYIQIAWPDGTVEDTRGNFVGYTMPLVDLKRSTVLENLLAGKTRKMMNLPEFYGYRVVAAANLASVVEALHTCGHHIIDLKPVNLNIYLDKFYIALLDCDGLSIRGDNGQRFSAHQYTDGYIAPEALQGQLRPRDLGEEQDRFALAVTLLQLLNCGIHPYQGVPRKGAGVPPSNSERVRNNLYAYGLNANKRLGPTPWSIHDYLEDETRHLFDQAFGGNAKLRPSAAQWKRHLQTLVDPASGFLRKCPGNADHGMFTKGCGFCHVEGVVKTAAQKKKTQAPHRAAVHGSPQLRRGRRATAPQRTGRTARPTSRARLKPLFIWGILLCLGIGAFYAHRTNIHSVIRRDDKVTFYKRVFHDEILWFKLDMEDARSAMVHDDEKMFCTIIENMESVPYDYSILAFLLNEKRIRSAQTYFEKMNDFQHRYHWLSQVVDTRSAGLIDSFNKSLQKSQDAPYLYAEVFLHRNIEEVRHILTWGADPNMAIPVDNYRFIGELGRNFTSLTERDDNLRYHIVEKLYAARGWVPNNTTCTLAPSDSSAVRSLCRRYSSPYKIPGASRIRDLMQSEEHLITGKIYAPKSASSVFRQGRPGLVYHVHPLTLAVLYSDLELTRVLLAAGAKLSNWIPDHASIFDLAPTRQIYQVLKEHGTPSDGMKQTLVSDDPEKMVEALKHTKKKRDRSYQSALMMEALESGSLRCYDNLRRRWKGPLGVGSITAIINAYRSGNPLLLAYLLKYVAPYDRTYTYEQIKKQYGPVYSGINKKNGSPVEYQALSRLAEKNHGRTKIGDLLFRMAIEDKAWAMAFVLDDHRSKWSDLHLAVLADDNERIKELLRKKPEGINQRDAIGRTPLILAAEYQCHISYGALMGFKPNLDAMDKSGYTPIMHAIAYGNEPMVRNLLERGAKLNTKASPGCAAALGLSLTVNSLAHHIEKQSIPGIADTIMAYARKIHNTHILVEEAAAKIDLPACEE